MSHKERINKICAPIVHLGATDSVTATDLRRVVDNLEREIWADPVCEVNDPLPDEPKLGATTEP